MNITPLGAIRSYEFASFANRDITHGVFARHGGVSSHHYTSLNLSISTGDTPANVLENRARAFRALGRDPASIADLWQVHSADVVVVDQPRGGDWATQQADALVTNRPEVTLFLRFADCVPIVLYDPKKQAIGLVHAGWKGTLLKVAAATVRALTEQYGSRPADVLAGIGPSIGPCHYQVGPEVVEQTRATFANGDAFLRPVNGGVHLDLWAANTHVLHDAGVEQVETGEVCTACHTEDFFSHRAERGQTGRFGALIALR